MSLSIEHAIVNNLNNLNESTQVSTRKVTPADLKKLKKGDTLYHSEFKGALTITDIHSDNTIYNKNYGIAGIRVKASNGNEYDLWYDTETLRRQKRVGDGLSKLSIPLNESTNLNEAVEKDREFQEYSELYDQIREKSANLATIFSRMSQQYSGKAVPGGNNAKGIKNLKPIKQFIDKVGELVHDYL
jgi:hypothetical protein